MPGVPGRRSPWHGIRVLDERQQSLAPHLRPRGGGQFRIVLLERVELGLGQVLEIGHGGLRTFQRPQQLVELDLHRDAVAVLGVLDEEDHQESHDRGARVDHELPGIAEVKQWAGGGPGEDDENGEAEGAGVAGHACRRLCEPCEPATGRHFDYITASASRRCGLTHRSRRP